MQVESICSTFIFRVLQSHSWMRGGGGLEVAQSQVEWQKFSRPLANLSLCVARVLWAMQTWQIFIAATRISHVTALLSHNSNASQEMHPHPHPHPHPAPLSYASVNVLCAVCMYGCSRRAFRGPPKIEGTKENHKSYRKLLQLLEFICKCCAAEISPICFVAFPFLFLVLFFFFFLN